MGCVRDVVRRKFDTSTVLHCGFNTPWLDDRLGLPGVREKTWLQMSGPRRASPKPPCGDCWACLDWPRAKVERSKRWTWQVGKRRLEDMATLRLHDLAWIERLAGSTCVVVGPGIFLGASRLDQRWLLSVASCAQNQPLSSAISEQVKPLFFIVMWMVKKICRMHGEALQDSSYWTKGHLMGTHGLGRDLQKNGPWGNQNSPNDKKIKLTIKQSRS